MTGRILIVFALLFAGNTTKAQLSTLKFDVELELNSVAINNVKDFDHTEDIAGVIGLKRITAVSKSFEPDLANSFSMYGDRVPTSLPNGTYPIGKRIKMLKNLTFTELKNIILVVGGQWEDNEGVLPAIPFFCSECALPPGGGNSNFTFRTLKFIETSTTQTSINNLQNNGLFQDLKFGDDRFFELNYYENRVKANGWLKFKWKVWVKPHA